jgi:hypothetical protein
MAATIVQAGATFTSGAATTVSRTMTSVTAGNLILVVLFGDKSLGTINTPTSSGGTPFTLIQKASLTSVSGSMYYKVADGGETTITQTYTTSQFSALYCMEISGLTSSPYDVSAMTATGNTVVTSISTGTTGITAQADELAIAVEYADTQSNCDLGRAWTNSFTEHTHVFQSGDQGGSVAKKTLTSTGTVESTYSTTDVGDQMMAIVATFKVNTGSAAAIPNHVININQAVSRAATH